MAKTLKEAPLTTRNARAKLGEGLHWRGIDPETHLGYRRGKRGGVWLVRWRHGAGYRQEKLATADDEISEGTLDYTGAVRAARERVTVARREDRARADGEVQTVRTAIDAYSAVMDERTAARLGRPAKSNARNCLERSVTGRAGMGRRPAFPALPLAEIPLHELSEADLIAWRNSLPAGLKRSARQRIANHLRAALNAAHREHRQKLPSQLAATISAGLSANAMPGVDDGGEGVARENQILSDETIGRVLAAVRDLDAAKEWGGDLFRLFVVLAATGARFSQVIRLRVGDVQAGRRRIMMPPSRKGRGGKAEAIPVPIGPDTLEALAPAIDGRERGEPLLMRWRMTRPPLSAFWQKTSRVAWTGNYEIIREWAAIRKAANLGPDVVAYSLRHSSIVRGIRAGLPLRLVAALHDTSVVMIERHYGRWIADGLDDLAAAAVVPLVPVDGVCMD